MKKTLIINLRRLGDVYSTGHLISSLKSQGEVEVSLLVYKETAKAAQNLAGVTEIFEIDRQELITIMNNKLFTDSYALDQLYSALQPIKSTKWDNVINFSNDPVGAYVCSYLEKSAQNIVGVHFNEQRNVVTQNLWEIIFNDVLTSVHQSPIHFVDCYHKMMNTAVVANENKVKINENHFNTTKEQLAAIKTSVASDGVSPKTIGIQIATSSTTKNISETTTVEFIKLLNQMGEFIPLILIAPTNEERTLANQLNAHFDNELIVVEADLNALASVIANIDLLVTPDTVTKHVADLCNTSCIEISLGEAPFLKQGTYRDGSYVLTDSISRRSFKADPSFITNIKASDIFASVLYHFSNAKNIKPILSDDTTLYRATHNQNGTNYVPVAGTIEFNSEILRLMSKQLINSLTTGEESETLYTDILSLGSTAVSTWCQSEKMIVTEIMKDLLGTLRSLLQSVETKRNSREFVMNLGRLMNHCETTSVSQIATLIFKTKIESINAKSFEENAKEVEILLYELKTNLQKNLACIKTLEDKIHVQKKEEFMQKSSPAMA